MDFVEEIEKLKDLKHSGEISEQEYQEAKASLLKSTQPAKQDFEQRSDESTFDTNMWGLFIHLSQFCGYVVPLAGLIVPIILWQIKKESDIVDRHGRIVINWIITEFMLSIVCALLIFVVIGIPLLLALTAAAIVFPIIGAVKASNGETWKYPCSIEFFKPR